MYIQSEKIDLFPLAKPRMSIDQKNNRLIGENNLAEIINQLTRKDVDGFVISDTYTPTLEVNIHGYHIVISDDITTVATNNNPIWISILIPATADFPEIYGQDVDGYYQGIEITQSASKPAASVTIDSTNYVRYSIKALAYSNGGWVVPNESRIIFDRLSLALDVVDAGTI